MASSASDYKSHRMMMIMIEIKTYLFLSMDTGEKEGTNRRRIRRKMKSWYLACDWHWLHASFYLKGFLLLLFEWREKRRRKTTCRHRALSCRSMITLDWLLSAFCRVLRSSSLIFTHYLLSIVSDVLFPHWILFFFFLSFSMNSTHSSKNLTLAMCLVSIQRRTYTFTHIVWEKKKNKKKRKKSERWV